MNLEPIKPLIQRVASGNATLEEYIYFALFIYLTIFIFGNWYHSIQITFYHSFAIKLFSFAGLPGRKNNLPAWDDRRTRKALSPKTDAEDLNSFKSSS